MHIAILTQLSSLLCQCPNIYGCDWALTHCILIKKKTQMSNSTSVYLCYIGKFTQSCKIGAWSPNTCHYYKDELCPVACQGGLFLKLWVGHTGHGGRSYHDFPAGCGFSSQLIDPHPDEQAWMSPSGSCRVPDRSSDGSSNQTFCEAISHEWQISQSVCSVLTPTPSVFERKTCDPWCCLVKGLSVLLARVCS